MSSATAEWRGLVNQLVYGVDTTGPVPDDAIHRTADLVIGQRVFSHPVATYYDAAMAALTSGDALPPGEEDFLRRLVDELAARHPWPEPPYRAVRDAPDPLPPMRSIGTVAQGWISVQQAVGFAFEPAGAEFRLLLRMANGALVLLRGSSAAPSVDVLTDAPDADAVAAVRAELVRATGLDLVG